MYVNRQTLAYTLANIYVYVWIYKYPLCKSFRTNYANLVTAMAHDHVSSSCPATGNRRCVGRSIGFVWVTESYAPTWHADCSLRFVVLSVVFCNKRVSCVITFKAVKSPNIKLDSFELVDVLCLFLCLFLLFIPFKHDVCGGKPHYRGRSTMFSHRATR